MWFCSTCHGSVASKVCRAGVLMAIMGKRLRHGAGGVVSFMLTT
jgi:hypothetical protein